MDFTLSLQGLKAAGHVGSSSTVSRCGRPKAAVRSPQTAASLTTNSSAAQVLDVFGVSFMHLSSFYIPFNLCCILIFSIFNISICNYPCCIQTHPEIYLQKLFSQTEGNRDVTQGTAGCHASMASKAPGSLGQLRACCVRAAGLAAKKTMAGGPLWDGQGTSKLHWEGRANQTIPG